MQRKASGKKQAEAYITVNKRYFLGQTKMTSAQYLSNLMAIKDKMLNGEINRLEEAKQALLNRLPE